MRPIYAAIKSALVDRGWTVDDLAIDSRDGAILEFVHPRTGRRYAYVDAIYEQMVLEIQRENRQ